MRDARGSLRPDPAFEALPADVLEGTLADRFEAIANRHPDRVAVRDRGTSLTYLELDRSANATAHALIELGRARYDRPVAVLAEQGRDLVVAILGILKTGAPYVPIDVHDGGARSRRAIDHVDPTAIVADAASAGRARKLAGHRPVVIVPRGSGRAKAPARNDDPDSAAYIYFTSGSTGIPKGVVDSHRNVLHNIRRYTNSLAIGPGDRISLVQTSGFSGAVSSLFSALLNGATSCPFDVRHAGFGGLRAWVRDEQLTIFHSVPSLFRTLLETTDPYPSIRVVRLEGDVASWADLDGFRRHFPSGAVLVNGLGATETGLVRQFFADRATSTGRSGLPLGYPVPDMEVLIVDADGSPVDDGEVGEIAVRSSYLATGYWGDPERTRRAFRRDEPGSATRTYRTGDLGRLEADGCLVGLGRADFVAKIRGQRVDVAEIERRLRESPTVADAVAITGGDGLESKLVAYVVPSMSMVIDPVALRRDLMGSLSAAEVPSEIVPISALPLGPAGKVDRARLPDAPVPAVTAEPGKASTIEPRTPLELELAELWTSILGVDRIGVSDDFFELGGDSFAAIRLLTELSERWGIEVADDAVLHASTIESLARRLEGSADTGGASSRDRVWFAVHADPGNTAFYARVARALPDGVQLVTLGPPPQGGNKVPWFEISTLARSHVAEIRRRNPAEPIGIAGFCFGAVVAFEMAQQLRADGVELGGVALLGISPLEFPTLASRRARGVHAVSRVLHRATLHAERVRAVDTRRGAAYLISGAQRVLRRRWASTRRSLAASGLAAAPGEAPDWAAASHDAIRYYRPIPFDGRVLVVLGRDSARAYTSRPRQDWSALARSVDILIGSGDDHDMLIDPGARALAKRLALEMGVAGSTERRDDTERRDEANESAHERSVAPPAGAQPPG